MHGGLITRLSRCLNQASFEGALRPERTQRRSRAIAQVAWAMHMDRGVEHEDKFGRVGAAWLADNAAISQGWQPQLKMRLSEGVPSDTVRAGVRENAAGRRAQR